MNKRIVFAGDSWFWTWSANLKSNFVRKNRQISFFELFFKQHWLDIKTLNKNGSELNETIDIINHFNPRKNDILVVFVSSPVRSSDTFFKYNIDTNNYDNFLNQFIDLYTIQFKHLDEWSKKHKIPVVLLGGQSPIIGETFDLYSPGRFLAYDIAREYVKVTRNDIKELEDIGPFALHNNWYKEVSEDWNPKIIEKIHSDFYTFSSFVENKGQVLFYPDPGHFNLTGQQFTLDYLFRYLKEQNLYG